MKILRFRNGRLRQYAQLQQSIMTLEDAIAALASEMASVGENTRALRGRLEELEKDEHRAAKPWRVLRLVALSFGLLLLAGVFTYTGVKGFANPLAMSSGLDSVSLAVRVPTPTADQLSTFGWTPISSVISATFDEDLDTASYFVAMSAEYAGEQFALVLEGTARIDQPFLNSAFPIASFRSQLSPCTGLLNGFGSTSQCQIITGRFPSKASGLLPVAAAEKCGKSPNESQKTYSVVAFEINGTPQPSISLDWAYQQYSLPGIDSGSPFSSYATRTGSSYAAGSLQNDVSRIPLDGWYEYTEMDGCREAILPDNMDLADIETPASETIGNQLTWNGPDIYDTAFVMRRPDADEIGNALLATGAAMAALGIGFVPVAYDADRERRKAWKRRRARKRAHPSAVRSE